jgi:hypothetical protein
MKDYEVLKVLIESNGGYLGLGKSTITQLDENKFTIMDYSGGLVATAEEVLNYLKS